MKNFEDCPLRHKKIDIDKAFVDVDSKKPDSPLMIGQAAHDAFHKRLRDGTPFPPEMIDYEGFAAKLLTKHQQAQGSKLLVEQKYAITRDFQPTGYFAKNVWYRGIADALLLDGHAALVIDWKTGGIKEDYVQLALMAQSVFSHYPQIQVVIAKYYWLREHAETEEKYLRRDMIRFWPSMLTRVAAMENAAQTQCYPPKPCGLCVRYCPVVSCQFHGKGNRS